MANAYHTKSVAIKVQWSRWREVEFMLGGWQSGYRSCYSWYLRVVVAVGGTRMPMWQMHITPSLWPLKCGGQGGERWNLC